jgi:hypothetical protein
MKKLRNIRQSQAVKKHPTYKKIKVGKLDWSHLAWELPSKTHYGRKDRRKARSDGKTRKKT